MKLLYFLYFFPLILYIYASKALPGTIIFEDDFSKHTTINNKIWFHEITASGCGNDEFQYQTNSRHLSQIENKTLIIEPNLTKTLIQKDPVQEGSVLEPGGAFPDICSDINSFGCRKNTQGKAIINPVVSAKLTTQKSFSFKQGKLEIIAKLPCGDWTWPTIWLMPKQNVYGTWPRSGEVDILESRGNVGSTTSDNRKIGPEEIDATLHWGPREEQDKARLTHSNQILEKGTFCDEFHTFGFQWERKRIKMQINNEENVYAEFDISNLWEKGKFSGRNIWTGNIGAPFDQEFFLILNVAIGGFGMWPDDGKQVRPKPWKNGQENAQQQFYSKINDWFPTWSNHKAALQIKKVTIWAVDETEFTY